jgi:nucleoside-diphosphate-sugar epimerase
VALVTGANKGIGFAIAAQLARARPDFHVPTPQFSFKPPLIARDLVVS